MPATLPTIVTPLPNDPRVMLLAKSIGLTRREAFGAAAEAWVWLSAMAVDGIVPRTEPDTLDGIVDVPGIGRAMLAAGLVGTVNDGLVLPGELRQRQRDDAERRSRHRGDDAAGDTDERRRGQPQPGKRKRERTDRDREADNERKRKQRRKEKLTTPATSPTRSEQSGPTRTPRRLGEAAGYPVMLLFRRDGVPFYKLAGATPQEWTGTVTDPENPSLADAFAAIHATMKRRERFDGDMRPTAPEVVKAAEAYRAARESTAADDQRRDTANRAFAEAATAGDDDATVTDVTPPCHAPVTHVTRDTVTVTLVSRSDGVTPPPNSSGERDLEGVTCHASVTRDAPSSSSSFCISGHEDTENTTTTSPVTVAERDADREVGILDRLLFTANPTTENRSRVDPEGEAKRQRTAERDARIAAALGIDIGTVRLRHRDYLDLQCRQAGIDIRTGLPINAGGSHKPAGTRTTLQATTEPTDDAEPATDILEARGDGDDDDAEATRAALAALGAVVTPKRLDDLGDDADGQHATLEHVRRGA